MMRDLPLLPGRRQAWRGLGGRGAGVLEPVLRRRDAGMAVRCNPDELAFLPAALSLQHTPVHPAPRWIALLLIGLFASAVAWACIGEVDIVAVAPGRIIVAERSKTIQPLERSVVQRIRVRDGDHVRVGQPLVELDATIVEADRASALDLMRAAQSELARTDALRRSLDASGGVLAPLRETEGTLRAGRRNAAQPGQQGEVAPAGPGTSTGTAGLPMQAHQTSQPSSVGWAEQTWLGGLPAWTAAERAAAQSQLVAEWDDIRARLHRWTAQVQQRRAEVATHRELLAKLESTLPLVQQREQDVQALARQGFIAFHAGQDRTRERIEMERDLQTQRARLQEAMAALAETQSGMGAFVAETRRALSERHAQAALRLQQALQDHAKARQRAQLTILRAPVAGIVQQLAVHTVGGVVTEAQPLLVIVPDDAVNGQPVAEVVLENKDIGFVRAGQSAELKFETFLFTRYGTVAATVQQVTADAVNDERRGAIFPARLALSRDVIDVDGKPIRLTPGMNVTAEIKTGQRRVIEYLLSPIQKAGGESLRER